MSIEDVLRFFANLKLRQNTAALQHVLPAPNQRALLDGSGAVPALEGIVPHPSGPVYLDQPTGALRAGSFPVVPPHARRRRAAAVALRPPNPRNSL